MQGPTATAPFDDEVIIDDSAECIYEVDVGAVRNAADAQEVVAHTRTRVHQGKLLRSSAEHTVVVIAPDGMSDDVRASLFPALGEGVDALMVEGVPSWALEDGKLTPERALLPQDGWGTIATAFENTSSLTAVVVGAVQGGFHVNVGRPAFLATDQVDLRPLRSSAALIGKKLEVRVVQFNVRAETLTVSRRTLLEQRRALSEADTLEKIHEGAILRGRVKTLAAYGVFVDLGGLDALLHVADIPACAQKMPAEVFSIGQEISVVVASYRAATQRIGLKLAAK